MAVTDYLPVAVAVGANVETQANFAGSSWQQMGFVTGVAKSAQANKVWRQATMMSSAWANLIVRTMSQNVPDDGNLNTLISQLQQTVNQIAVTAINATGLAQRVATLEATVSGHTSQIAALASRVTVTEGNIANLSSRLSVAEGNIANNLAALNALTVRVTNVENGHNALYNQVQGIASQVGNALGRIGNLENAYSSQQGQINDLYNRLSALDTRVTNNANAIASINTQIGTINGHLSSHDGQITDLYNLNNGQQNSINDLYTRDTNQTNSINAINGHLGTHDSQIGDLYNRDGTQANQISAIQAALPVGELMLPGRGFGGTYQNTLGYPIFVAVTGQVGSGGALMRAYIGPDSNAQYFVGGADRIAASNSNPVYMVQVSFIVKNGWWYRVDQNGGNTGPMQLVVWAEYQL